MRGQVLRPRAGVGQLGARCFRAHAYAHAIGYRYSFSITHTYFDGNTHSISNPHRGRL
jgi:hypothetical protein